MPRYKTIDYPNYSAMFKDAALYGMKKGAIVGALATTLLALWSPEAREHLIALYSSVVPLGALAVTAVEIINAPLEHRVIRSNPQNPDGLTQRM